MISKTSCGAGTATLTNTSPVAGCQGDKYTWDINYTDPLGCNNSQTPRYQYLNGTTATSTSPEVQFNVPGLYIIRLTVTAIDAGLSCPDSYKQDTFFVKGLPKVTLNPLSAICVNNNISPGATIAACYSPGPLGYLWTFTN